MGLHQILVVDTEDPLTYEEAIQRTNSKAWQEAMKSEMQSMYDNKVWTLVDLPNEKRPIQYKWIFERKMDLNGNMTTYYWDFMYSLGLIFKIFNPKFITIQRILVNATT